MDKIIKVSLLIKYHTLGYYRLGNQIDIRKVKNDPTRTARNAISLCPISTPIIAVMDVLVANAY